MREKNQETAENRIEEHRVLLLYSLIHFVSFCISLLLRWPAATSIVIVLAAASCWVVYARKMGSYHLRVLYSSVAIQAVLLVCASNTENMFSVLIPYMVVVVAMGFYGDEKIFWITPVFSTAIFLCHAFIKKTIVVDSFEQFCSIGIPIVSVYLLEGVVYFWVKRHNATSSKMTQVIRELEITEKTKDEFLANVSHEIRTPINTIGGMCEIALAEKNMEKMRENIYFIQVAERNLMNVVSDILDFSELQSSKMEIEEEAYNMTSTVNDVISMGLALKEGKNLEFIVDCDPNMPCNLLGDEKKIRRVIMNLLNNAIKFTNMGGICLEVSFRKESYGGNLVIVIQDTGIGMTQETVERLFTSYNQADTSIRRKSGGIGLGLAISKALVRGMGGTITVKSQPERGTAMKVVIPQKVLDERPVLVVENKESYNILFYINLEQFELRDVRDAYGTMFGHMESRLGIRMYNCRSQAELQRRIAREKFTHIIISKMEFFEDPEYYRSLAKRETLCMIIDREDERLVEGMPVICLHKPFDVLSLAGLLNGNNAGEEPVTGYHDQFIAPEARVLVVDDNEMNIMVVEGLLQKYRIQVVGATSGKQALEIIERKDFDFVFMDQMMPEMDGIETLKQIRSKPGTYYWKVPVIALTANAIGGAREMLLAEGFADFVEKPVENSVLARVLLRNLPEEKIVRLEETEEAAQQIGAAQSARESRGMMQSGVVQAAQGTMQQSRVQTVQPGQRSTDGASMAENAGQADRSNSTETGTGAGAKSAAMGAGAGTVQAHDAGSGSHDGEKSGQASGEVFEVGDLNVKTALMYCGGMENYKRILKNYADKDKENWEPIEELFAEENWNDYTIAVHAVKSTMLSIGAQPVSEMAKALERAGKENDLEYIRLNHAPMIAEYIRVIREIQDAVGMPQEADGAIQGSGKTGGDGSAQSDRTGGDGSTGNEVTDGSGVAASGQAGGSAKNGGAGENGDRNGNAGAALEQLSKEAFDSYVEKLEEAMYDLDGAAMKDILEEMKPYAFGDVILKDALKPIEKKIDNADYMSAVEKIQKLGERQVG